MAPNSSSTGMRTALLVPVALLNYLDRQMLAAMKGSMMADIPDIATKANWGFFDCNNMPILCQIVRPQLRATGYGTMNLVSIGCGGFADWGFGLLRDR